jgi:hypothetical protein
MNGAEVRLPWLAVAGNAIELGLRLEADVSLSHYAASVATFLEALAQRNWRQVAPDFSGDGTEGQTGGIHLSFGRRPQSGSIDRPRQPLRHLTLRWIPFPVRNTADTERGISALATEANAGLIAVSCPDDL